MVAGGILATAAIVLGVTLTRAMTLDVETESSPSVAESPVVETESGSGDTAPRVPSAGRLDSEAIRLAVDNDPFQPERRRAEAYMMPGERIEPEEPPELPPPPPFRLLGTAETDAGGIAVMQVEDSDPKILGLGESMMGYRLDQIEGNMATLFGQGRTLTITVADASPQPAARRTTRGARGARGGARGNATDNAERAREMLMLNAERIQQMIQQLRERGAPPEVIEQLMRQGEVSIGGVEVIGDRNGRAVVIRPRRDTSSVPDPRVPNER
jgi:hypothetical protein